MPNELEDSGKVRLSPTGAQRDSSEGKGRYDLFSPIAMARKARINQLGAAKRGDRNWEKGMPLSWFIDSALRHIFEYLEGMANEDHLAQAGWNLDCAMHTEEMVIRGLLPAELMDLPNYVKPVRPSATHAGHIACCCPPPNPIHESVGMGQAKESFVAKLQRDFAELCALDGAPVSEKPPKPFTVAKPLRFYVGGPYSHDDSWIRERNTREALAICTQIARRGHFVLSPHAATSYLDGVMPYEYFMVMDLSQIIAWSNAYFHIAESPGANRELELSKKKGNPLFFHIDQVPFVEPNNYVPLDEQQPSPSSSTAKPQQSQEGRCNGDSDLEQADQTSRGDQTVHGPHGHPDEASCGLAEESR